jgi:hypothetical protein
LNDAILVNALRALTHLWGQKEPKIIKCKIDIWMQIALSFSKNTVQIEWWDSCWKGKKNKCPN